MKLRKNPYLKKQKQRQLVVILLVLVVACYVLSQGHWVVALVLLAGAFLVRELFFADARFYDPAQDYQYRLSGAELACEIIDGRLSVPDAQGGDSLVMSVPVRSTFTGRFLDPQLVLGSANETHTFERGARGQRYIDLSPLAAELASGVAMRTNFCSIDWQQARVVKGSATDYTQKPMLVIAPHADDAEIAAFGLYSQAVEPSIVTITAGETETEQFATWCEDDEQASLFKGRVRTLDSFAAARWGGVSPGHCHSLGYPCLQLYRMKQEPATPVASPWSGIADTRPYRAYNPLALASDGQGESSWQNLVMDLRELLRACKPAVVVAPHPALDAHVDHIYASMALLEALRAEGMEPDWLLYANHLEASQGHPCGPAGGLTGLPPHFGEPLQVAGYYSQPLDDDTLRDKALALDLMHDLRRPLSWKKWLRPRLQAFLPGRSVPRYGEDDYFRKSLRRNECFIVADTAQVDVFIQEQGL